MGVTLICLEVGLPVDKLLFLYFLANPCTVDYHVL